MHYNFSIFHLIHRRSAVPLPLKGKACGVSTLVQMGESPRGGRLEKFLRSSNYLCYLTAGARPLCVKGAVAALAVTGGLSPSVGQRFSEHLHDNPSVFLLRKNPPPFTQGRLLLTTSLYRFHQVADTSSTAVRRSPFPSRGRLEKFLHILASPKEQLLPYSNLSHRRDGT